jgi:hypothetical protein
VLLKICSGLILKKTIEAVPIPILAIELVMLFSLLPLIPYSEASTGYGFTLRGASVDANCFVPSAQSYYPNTWQLLQKAGINWIRVNGGTEGDIIHFGMVDYPNEWAQNLNIFLSQADSFGIKVSFTTLGTTYGTLFGIVSPGTSDRSPPNAPYTSIPQAEAMIDQLAGNNSLQHDFITDPRVLGWVTSNEVYIGSSTSSNPNNNGPLILDWNLKILDYIRSKGGKAWIASPTTTLGSTEGYDFSDTYPLIAGHVDFLEAHYYALGQLTRYFEGVNGEYDWQGFKQYYKNLLINNMIDFKGNQTFSTDNILLGEFGMWIGPGDDMGLKKTFTGPDRINYYKAVLDAAKDAGLTNVCQHDFFQQADSESTDYSIVSFRSNDFYTNDASSVLVQAYGSNLLSPSPTNPSPINDSSSASPIPTSGQPQSSPTPTPQIPEFFDVTILLILPILIGSVITLVLLKAHSKGKKAV